MSAARPISYVYIQIPRMLAPDRPKNIGCGPRGTPVAVRLTEEFIHIKVSGGNTMLKKYFTSLLMMTVIGVMIPLAGATSADAQTRYYNARTGRYTTVRRTTIRYKRPNVYRRHRKAFNIGIGTGIGMLVGGLLGGKKGVVIGGLAGAGGGALVTHKQRPKNYVRRVVTYRR